MRIKASMSISNHPTAILIKIWMKRWKKTIWNVCPSVRLLADVRKWKMTQTEKRKRKPETTHKNAPHTSHTLDTERPSKRWTPHEPTKPNLVSISHLWEISSKRVLLFCLFLQVSTTTTTTTTNTNHGGKDFSFVSNVGICTTVLVFEQSYSDHYWLFCTKS